MRVFFAIPIAALCFVPLVAIAVEIQERELQEEAQAQEDTQEPDAQDVPPENEVMDVITIENQDPIPPAEPRGKSVPPSPAEPPKSPDDSSGTTDFDTVLLQGLNKVTARAQALEAPIGSVIRYGTIEIIAHKCWKSAASDRPENAALLEVSELKQGEAPHHIFSGWMFSSTPGLSSLEHPFYDINVIACSKEGVKP
jgi:hypothetical protein